MFKKCVLHKIDMNIPEEVKVFKWYWEDCIGKVAGVQNGWNEHVKHYTIISKAKLPGDETKPLVPANSEAFLLLVYENCHDKWVKHIEWYDKNPCTKMPNRNSTEKAKQENAGLFDTKFTTQDGGQMKYGGWKDGGLQKYVEYTKAINDRKKNHMAKYLKVETDFLKQLRQELGLESESIQEERSRKKHKNKGGQQEKKFKIRIPEEDEDMLL